MVQPPFEIFLVPIWLRVPIWSGTHMYTTPVKIEARIVNGPCTPTFLSLSIKFTISQSNGVGTGGGWMSVLTPVNEGAYVKQYENKDAEVQTTYT